MAITAWAWDMVLCVGAKAGFSAWGAWAPFFLPQSQPKHGGSKVPTGPDGCGFSAISKPTTILWQDLACVWQQPAVPGWGLPNCVPFVPDAQHCLEKEEGIKYTLPCHLSCSNSHYLASTERERKAFAAVLRGVSEQSRSSKGVVYTKLHQDLQPHCISLGS